MSPEQERFIEAQRRMLKRYGVSATSRFVPTPSISGNAHALVVDGEGPQIALLNGIGTPAAMWAPLMAELPGFRLHAIDLPAFGLTDPYEPFADDLRANAVAFLEEVLDGLGLVRPTIIANSLGSLCASWLALDRPSRVGAIVHIGCPAVALDTSAPFPMRLLSVPGIGRLLMRLQPPSPKQVEQLGKMVREQPLEPELVELLVATESLAGFESTFRSILHALIRLRGNRPSMNLSEERLGRIQQPTLLIWGKDDPFGSPQVGERFASAMPKAEFRLVDGGHGPWLKRAKEIAPDVVAFIGANTVRLRR